MIVDLHGATFEWPFPAIGSFLSSLSNRISGPKCRDPNLVTDPIPPTSEKFGLNREVPL